MFMKKLVAFLTFLIFATTACGAPGGGNKPSPGDGGKWGCYVQSNNLLVSKHKTFDIAMAACEEEEVRTTIDHYVMGPDKVKVPVNPDFPEVIVPPADLPNGTINQAYPSTTMTATGGYGPYKWVVAAGSLPPGLQITEGGTILGTPLTATGSPFAFKLAAQDTRGTTAAQSFTITILGLAPSITTTSLPNVEEGSAYNQTLAATAGTPPLSWALASGTLPTGLTLSPTGAITGTAPLVAANTTSTFTVRVTDSSARTASKELSITVTAATNVVVTAQTLPLADVGVPFTGQIAATGGKTPYTFAVTGGSLPAGIVMSGAGTITGTPTTASSATFTVTATDAIGQTDTETFTITVRPAPPVITTTSLPSATVAVPYNATVAWSGGAGPYTVALASGALPSGIGLLSSGVISGIPAGPAGTANFTVRVTDANGKSGSKALSITVVPPALTITTTTVPNAKVGTPYSQQLTAAGGSLPYVWSNEIGLPPGITLSTDGLLSGNPGTAGEYSFLVRVTDGGLNTTTTTLTITVENAALVSYVPATLPPAEVNGAYSFTFTAGGGNGTYSWSILSGDVPPGLTLSTAGVFSGTPLSNLLPQYTFTVRVTDGTESVQSAVTIVVQNDSVPDADASLSWTPPNQYVDGTALPLDQLGGYRVYARPMGSTTWTYDFDIPNNMQNWYEFMELPIGVWEFSVRAYDNTGSISDFSSIASKEILQ